MGSAEICCVLLDSVGLFWVLLDFSWFLGALLNSSKLCCVLLDSARFY